MRLHALKSNAVILTPETAVTVGVFSSSLSLSVRFSIQDEAMDVVAAVVEASAPKVYPRVTLASASTLSGSVVGTLRGGEGLPNMFCLVASSLGHIRSQSRRSPAIFKV